MDTVQGEGQVEEEHIVEDQEVIRDDEDGEVMDDMFNIQTRPAEIQNPSNLEVQMPKLPVSTPETTKVNSRQQQLEGCISIEDGRAQEGKADKPNKGKRQQSAVTRTTTTQILGNNRAQQSAADLRKKNSLQTKISVLRHFSGK